MERRKLNENSTFKKWILQKSVRATIWFTTCNFIVKAISFIAVPIFTRCLTTEEYGIVSVYSSYQQILCILATFELSLGAYNRGYLKYKDKLEEFTTALLLASVLITVILCIFLIPFISYFVKVTETNQIVYYLTFVMFLFLPSYNCWLCNKRYEMDYKPAVFVTVLYTLITRAKKRCLLCAEPSAFIKCINT